MKVHNFRTGFDGLGHVQPEPTQPAGSTPAGRPDRPADQVKLSSGAQLASTALGAAGQAADIRQDRVDRAKALLADGRIGNDPFSLADAIIDRTIDNQQ